MPIYKTNTFWDYLANEPLMTINKAKELLNHKTYNFDTKTNDITTYWQRSSNIEIEYCQHEVIRFPGGLTSWLANNLGIMIDEKRSLDKKWTDEEIQKIAEEVHTFNPKFEIRDYQLEATSTSLNNFRSLINASVGSGKSSIMSLVCKCLLTQNNKILILNGNNIILSQIAERLESFDINSISFDAGKRPDFTKSVVVLNIAYSDSLLNQQDEEYINYLKNDVKTIIYDEAHHIGSVTAMEPIFYTNPDNLKHLIGYSGSPFRDRKHKYNNADDFRTIAILGEPNFNYEMKDAIQEGSIAQPYGYFIRYKNREISIPSNLEDNYYMRYRFNITYNKARNTAGIEILKFLDKNNINTFVSINNTKVAQKHMKELKQKGINSLMMHGGNTIYEWIKGPRGGLKLETRKGGKKEIEEALNNKYNVVFGTSVLDEGVSIDVFQAAVLFSAGKTNIAGIQRLGRASRKRYKGSNVSFVIDFQDINGHPTFEDHYRQRREIMEESGIKIFTNVLDFITMIEAIGKENIK